MDCQGFHKLPDWTPNEKSGEIMKKFMKRIEEKYSVKFADYFEFHKWSVEHISEFWAEMWYFMGIIYSKTFDQVIDLSIPMEDCPNWFEGAKVNYAENLLKFRDDRVAIISTGENKATEKVTFRQLYEEAKLYAAAFRNIGLKKGDRVTCCMSNRKEAVIAMLAATSIGAIWTGHLPHLGPQAYLNRVSQVEPTVLITVDQFSHYKEVKQLLKNIKEITEGMPSIRNVIIVPSTPESKSKDISAIPNSCFLDDFLRGGRNPDGTIPEMKFEQLPVSHPVFISYTSGTTGIPKAIVHGFSILLSVVRDMWLHMNNQREDVWLSISPVGWVTWTMWNNVLFLGGTLVLFEGMPFFQSPTYFWDMVDELKLTKLFILPAVLDEMKARKYLPTHKHHLNSLNVIISGGYVVEQRIFDFVRKMIKKDVMCSIIYGCTELMGICSISGQSLPVYSGEISAPSLGVALECLDEAGKPVYGEKGECVISTPLPSFLLELWGDNPRREQLKKLYFSKFSGKFSNGDVILINPITKGILCYGRRDETLSRDGWRFGSSEIYNIIAQFSEICDSLCVSQISKDKYERAILFVKMQEENCFNDELVQRIREKITDELSVQNRIDITVQFPEIILQVLDIPYNFNGKKMENIVTKIINNKTYNIEMVANPDCLKYYCNVPELQVL